MAQKLSELIANDLNVIKNSLVIPKFNLTATKDGTPILDLSAAPLLNENKALVYSALGPYDLLLKSLFISYDSTFASKFSIYTELNGLNIDDNAFTNAPSGSQGFDYVPTGSHGYLIPAQSKLKIWAYNSGGATSGGVLNVLAVFDRLDTYA